MAHTNHRAETATPFGIIALAPWASGVPAIAAAAARAGAIGLIDLEFASGPRAADDARHAVQWLCDHVGADDVIGVRLRPSDQSTFAAALAAFGTREIVIVFAQPPTTAEWAMGDALTHARVLCEVRTADDLSALVASNAIGAGANGTRTIEGLIACGHECGGFVGAESTFVLVQRLLDAGLGPVYARGGLGVAAATGCRAAGVAGIVLDDQLLLTPESPLPVTWRQQLRGLSGQETTVLGTGAAMVRVFDRPLFAAVAQLKGLALACEAGDAEADVAWPATCRAAIGWREPGRGVWPIGQAVILAERYQTRLGGTAQIVRHFQRETARRLALAGVRQPVAPGSPLAESHGTTYPIVQGPMTRVSDVPAFASDVAAAGALPLIALAVLTGEQSRPILDATRDALGSRPWGVGVLGFVPPALKQAQFDEIRRVKPPFALVAGGRPDDAASLEADGIATYLHVPVASLLRRFLAQGARRFVFEGRECGGHVGPLCSFPLWETMIDELLQSELPAPSDVHVLFAGGIHDARSAAIVSAMAAPLAARGIRCGVLMGTAYLFTVEAVTSGAITARYQREAMACQDTVLLVSGVGHANRVARTAFAAEYAETRRTLLKSGQLAEDVRDALERLTLGRLRLASKGVHREPDQQALVAASDEAQMRGGIFMLGQVAALRDTPVTMRELHEDVSAGSVAVIAAAQARAEDPDAGYGAHPIAIVGMSTLVPGARHPESLWRNLLDKTNAITEIPASRWDVNLLYDADAQARDRINARWGGFFEDIPFDPVTNRMPPAVLPQVCSHQLLALEATRWALADAGYLDNKSFDRSDTAVIVGVAETGGLTGNGLITRTMLPFVLDDIPATAFDRLPEWTGESFTGMLGNVTAGRIANQLDLGGANFCVDAACATSLVALDLAAREIREGRSSMAVAASVDTLQTPFGFTAFAKTQALSPTGEARVFDTAANGMVSSEGVAVVILKSLADARRDGDRVYAVIRGQGASADGRGLGLTAPAPAGQRRAIDRALHDAQVTIDTIDLYEAHGTGTSLGDRTEIETLTGVLRAAGVGPRRCAIGSAKSLVGHTKAAAGMVGLIKATHALRHRTLPPHAGVTSPIPALADPSSPLALYDRPRPWFAPADHRRRAGVNAFGFGGTNGSIVLEDSGDATAAGADRWPSELFLFAGADDTGLSAALGQVRDALAGGAEPRLRDLAAALATRCEESAPGPRAAIVAASREALAEAVALAMRHLGDAAVALPPHVIIARQATAGRVAFLFPGQGAQSPNMALDHAVYFDEVRAAVERADHRVVVADGVRLSDVIYPPAAFTPADTDAQRAALAATDVAQPAIGAVSIGVFDLLERLGVRADLMAGHSYGELTALYAAGALNRDDFFALSAERGRAMARCCGSGGMLAIEAARDIVATLVDGVDGIAIANHNGPTQVVISGTSTGLAAVRERASAAKVRVVTLNVAGAFHSPEMAAAAEPWRMALERVTVLPGRVPVYSNVTASVHATAPQEIRERLAEQLLQPVEFVREIEQMYADGARVFVEVGPGNILSRLVGGILGAREHLVVATDSHHGKLEGFLRAIGTLVANGVACQPSRLFLGRDIAPVALDRLHETAPRPLSPTTWWVNGSGPRPSKEPKLGPARESMLTRETRRPGRVTATPTEITSIPAAARTPMPPAATAAPPSGVAPSDLLAAYAAYQETMRTFLAVQEQVFAACLNAGGGFDAGTAARMLQSTAASIPTVPTVPMVPTLPAVSAMPVAPASPAPQSAVPVVTSAQAPEPASTTATSSGDELADRVLRVFAAQTGYPVEMLGLDMDLSSDLGVDSIRQVQALSELADALPVETRAAVSAISDELVRMRTLGAILDRVRAVWPSSGISTTTSVAPAASAGAATATHAATSASLVIDRAALVTALQQLASERTGYPPELLSPAQDLEADLGVDSIRRADLLQAFVAMLPGHAQLSPADTDRVMRARTIDEIVGLVLALAGPTAATDAACPSFLPAEIAASLRSDARRTIDGSVVIIADDMGVTPLLVQRLEAIGIAALVVSRRDAITAEQVERRIASIMAASDRIGAVVHLAPLSAAPVPHTLDEWHRRTQLEAKSLFQTLRALSLADRSIVDRVAIVAASLMGGRYGRGGVVSPGAPTGGAAIGMLRCLAREWPGASGRAVDFSGDMPAADIAGRVLDELLHRDPHVEVGYLSGTRLAFGTAVTPRESGAADPALTPEDGWVVLATGGARGITAEAVEALARPGVTVVLASRTPAPPDVPEPAERAALDARGLRDLFLREALGRGERPTPVQIDQRVTRALHERDLAGVHQRLVAAGATVVPMPCDVRDGDAVAGLVRHLYDRYGRIDAVIHGAGIIDDGLVVNKTPESFDRVFDTKVNAAFSLARAIRPDGLKLMVFFSSVAGRAGSAGQTDYAAANEVLSRMAWWLRGEWPATRIVSIAWGPWAGTGMAGETVRARLLERGIEPIEPAAGRALLETEMSSQRRTDVEIVAGVGPWDEAGPVIRPTETRTQALAVRENAD